MNDTVTREKLAHDLREVVRDTEALIKIAAEDLGDKAKDVQAKLAVKLGEARRRLSEVESYVREKAVAGAKQADVAIREHPYESIAVAFGFGVLIGILVSRK